MFSESYILDEDARIRLIQDTSKSHSQSPNPPSVEDGTNDFAQAPSELTKQNPQRYNADADQDPNLSSTSSSYHTMTLHDRPYLCSIPTVLPSSDTTSTPKDPDAEAAELARATDRGWELLKDMEGNCMYFISGWWSYSFCYNTAVKQFHPLPPGKGAPLYPPTEDPTTPSYVLGKFTAGKPTQQKPHPQLEAGEGGRSTGSSSSNSNYDGEKDTASPQLQAKGSVRYLVQKLQGGTTCDLTGRERKVEVQFHCHPQSADRIGWIKEVSTCSYLMVIYTPRLCNDVAFLPPRENKAYPITCKEIVSQSSISDWEARKRAERERKMVSAASGGRPVVAGIEVGGMKQVGKEGQRLEPPAQIAPQGPPPKADLLARQDAPEKGGKVYKLGHADLKKLGVDPKLVDEAVKELKTVAAGKAWKLEVFESPMGGKELRGVVEGDGGEAGGAEEEAVEIYVVEREEADDDDLSEGEDGRRGSEEVFRDEL